MSAASVVPPPARGDVGDLGRHRIASANNPAADDAPAADGTGGFTTDEERRSGMTSWAVSPAQPYEGEIKRLFRVFFDFFLCTDERKELFDSLPLPSDSSKQGFYRRSLELICAGNVKALHNLDRSQSAISKATGFLSFPIRVSDVAAFGEALLKWVIEFPADVLVYADEEMRSMISNDILPTLGVAQPPFAGIRVSFCHHPHVCALRDLDPTSLERLVAIQGTVIRVSHVIPEMQIAVFRCTNVMPQGLHTGPCNNEVSEVVINGNVTEPNLCRRCQNRHSFVLVHDKCVFGSKQLLKVQENPESIPEGETPQTLFVYMYDSLVDCARPGDRAVVTGIFRATSVRKNVRVRSLKAVFRTAIDAIHVDSKVGSGLELDEGDAATVPTADDEYDNHMNNLLGAPQLTFHPSFLARAKALADQPNVYEMLIDSFAPNIWEHVDVKKGLLCQLFGGSSEVIIGPDGLKKRVRSRGDIHVLLCGDPSTAKSQFLQYVHKIAPRGVYAVGRGTSAAGLTATVTRDPETKEFVLESGAVVLSDRGICCIDEFDKMDDSTRAILHEVMEQQTVSLAKAGLVCSLNARAAILASANPIQSKYDIRKSVIENINLPSTLLSRFDLIYLVLDAQNEELDRRLAEHLCGMYTKPDEAEANRRTPPLDKAFMTQYISYARKTCFPELTTESTEELVNTYLTLRQSGRGGSLAATPRQLDSLVRLSRALAKMQLSNHVLERHVKEAARLIRAATYQALVDPLTGRIDFEQLHQGLSAAQRARQALLGNIVVDILEEVADSVPRDALIQRVEERLLEGQHPKLQRKELERALEHFEATRLVAKVQGHKYIRGSD